MNKCPRVNKTGVPVLMEFVVSGESLLFLGSCPPVVEVGGSTGAALNTWNCQLFAV